MWPLFLGIGALATALLLQLGIIETRTSQYMVFAIVSLLTLLLARKQFKRWFVGFTASKGESKSQLQRDIGNRVTVIADFQQGQGRVTLNGVSWDAESEEALKTGEVAWVTANEGIHLKVSRLKPTEFEPINKEE